MPENTTNNPPNTTATDLPPAPNGHGAGNGAANGEPHQDATVNEHAAKDAAPSSKKQKKAQQRAAAKTAAASSASNASTATTATTTPEDPQPAATTPPPPSEVHAAPPIVETAAAPIIDQPAASLRLRMKVWTDHRTSKRYLMPSAFMRDVVNGQPISDVMYAYALRADDIQRVTLTAGEWQALPFVYVQEEGPPPVIAGQSPS